MSISNQFQICGLLESERQVNEIIGNSTSYVTQSCSVVPLSDADYGSCLEDLANAMTIFKWEMVLSRLKRSPTLQAKLTPKNRNFLHQSGKGLKKYRTKLIIDARKNGLQNTAVVRVERILLDCDFLEEKLNMMEGEESQVEQKNEKSQVDKMRSMCLENEMLMEKSIALSVENESLEKKLKSMESKMKEEYERLKEEKSSLDRQSSLYELQKKTMGMENRVLQGKCDQHKSEMDHMFIVINDLRSELADTKKDVSTNSCTFWWFCLKFVHENIIIFSTSPRFLP